MREIAIYLGISTGSLYHYFPSKQSILPQMFDMVSQHNVSQAVSLLGEDMSLKQKLDAFQVFWKESMPHYHKLLLLAVDFYRNSEDATKVLSDFVDYHVSNITHNLRLPERVSQAIVVYILGLVCRNLLTDHDYEERQTQTFNDLILNYVEQLETNR